MQKQIRILICKTDMDVIILLNYLINEAIPGVEVSFATSVTEAEAIINTQEPFDLLITGYEFANRFGAGSKICDAVRNKNGGSQTKIIVLSLYVAVCNDEIVSRCRPDATLSDLCTPQTFKWLVQKLLGLRVGEPTITTS